MIAALNVSSASLTMMPIQRTPAGVVTIDIPLDGQVRSITLRRHSVRAANFRLLVQGADGSLVPVAPGPPNTLRGEIDGLPGSVVAASLTGEGLRARIILPDETTYWVEPLAGRIASARDGEHVVYRGDDVVPSGGTCATAIAGVDDGGVSGTPGTVSGTGGLFLAELLIDTDYEFFELFGDLDAAAAYVTAMYGAANRLAVSISKAVIPKEPSP
ncbi:MAG: hypothetical protein IH897_04955 [Planctomycetes bacterium]|nr:hypothetical protein [Planctomycetota bacterium]